MMVWKALTNNLMSEEKIIIKMIKMMKNNSMIELAKNK